MLGCANGLEAGNVADAALVSMPAVSDGYANQPIAELMLRRAKAAHVTTVMIGGKVMLDEGRWVGFDPDALRAQLSESVSTGPRSDARIVGEMKDVVRNYLKSYETTSP